MKPNPTTTARPFLAWENPRAPREIPNAPEIHRAARQKNAPAWFLPLLWCIPAAMVLLVLCALMDAC